jgi:hypothetical protein
MGQRLVFGRVVGAPVLDHDIEVGADEREEVGRLAQATTDRGVVTEELSAGAGALAGGEGDLEQLADRTGHGRLADLQGFGEF